MDYQLAALLRLANISLLPDPPPPQFSRFWSPSIDSEPMASPALFGVRLLAVISLATHCQADLQVREDAPVGDRRTNRDFRYDLVGRVRKGAAHVKYPDPECRLAPLDLTLSCQYNRNWQEKVVLHVGKPPSPAGNASTIGHWRLPLPYGLNWRMESGLAVYNLSVEWHCPVVRKRYSTFPFSVGLPGWTPIPTRPPKPTHSISRSRPRRLPTALARTAAPRRHAVIPPSAILSCPLRVEFGPPLPSASGSTAAMGQSLATAGKAAEEHASTTATMQHQPPAASQTARMSCWSARLGGSRWSGLR